MTLWHLVIPRSSRCVVQESLSKPCYCDKSCTYFRDCCEDYRQFCRKPPVSHWGIAITRNKKWHAPFWVFSGFRLGRKFYLYYHESKYNFARLPGPLSICWPEVHKYEELGEKILMNDFLCRDIRRLIFGILRMFERNITFLQEKRWTAQKKQKIQAWCSLAHYNNRPFPYFVMSKSYWMHILM